MALSFAMKPKGTSEVSERIEYFDVLRGLAIFSVVAIHSSDSGLQFGKESINFNFTVLWRNILNFGVPLFLAISGFFLAKKPIVKSSEYFEFIKKQILKVYFPLLIWSLVWLSFSILIQNKPAANELIKLFIFQSSGPYYFIALIIQYYLLLPILKKLANKKGLIISIFISITMTCVIFYLRYRVKISPPLILYAGNFATWQMFFVLGLYLGSSARIKITNNYLVVSIIAFYALSCTESYILISLFDQAGDAVTAVKVSSFMYSFFLIIFLFKNHNLIKSRILKQIGAISFGIYLIHMFALMAAHQILYQLYSPLKDVTYVHQFLLITIVLLFCFICISLFNKVLSTKQAQTIGFK